MLKGKRFVYMLLGGFLALALAFGGAAIFAAQIDDAPATPSETSPETPSETTPDTGSPLRDLVAPFLNQRGERGFGGAGTDQRQALADALGITVEELEAAQEQARVAMVEQAVADGLLTQEQADAILENGGRARRGLGLGDGSERQSALAEALGISTDALESAMDQVFAAELAAKVEAGVITQEHADMIAARRAVQDYVDREGIEATIQAAHEAAIAQALADGAITQAQADALLENLSSGLRDFGFGGPGGRCGRGHGRHGGPGSSGGGAFGPLPGATDAGLDA